jgi:hypothetical protein
MSNPPAGKEKSNSKESAITVVFVSIVNSIIAVLHMNDRRVDVAVDRQKIAIPTRDGSSLKPNVFL